MEIPSAKSKFSFIKKFIQERNLVNVGKLPFRCHTSVSREFVVGKTPLPVRYVGKSSATNQLLLSMSIFIIERNLLNVMNVEKHSAKSSMSLNIRTPILERSFLNVTNVENPSARRKIFLPIRKFTLEKELATPSVFSAGEFHGQRSLTSCSPWGRREPDTAE